MCDQALKFVLVPLNQMGSRTVFGGKDCEVHTTFSTCLGYPVVGSKTFSLSLVFFSSSQFLGQTV